MIRKNYIPKGIIYLDNASTTIPYSCDVPDNLWFNASAPYKGGVEAKEILNQCKEDIIKIFNITQGDVLFTSGATESNNIIIQSVVDFEKGLFNLRNIIVSPTEHPSVLNVYKEISSKGILEVRYLPVDKNGNVIIDEFNNMIDYNTLLVSCMYVNNETGTIQPIEELGKICKSKDTLFHVDATQAIGKVEIDCLKDNIDFLTFSAHKFHGPKGIGAIVCSHQNKYNFLSPIMYGGHQQKSIRPGTENVADIYFMTKLLKEFCDSDNIEESKHFSRMANRLLKDYLSLHFKNYEYRINSIDFDIPIMSISFKNITGEYLVQELSKHNIYVSSGSACMTGTFENSYVLESMKVDSEFIEGTIRISFDPFEIDDKSLMETILKIKEIILK
jgi:cysteine desulfurase